MWPSNYKPIQLTERSLIMNLKVSAKKKPFFFFFFFFFKLFLAVNKVMIISEKDTAV